MIEIIGLVVALGGIAGFARGRGARPWLAVTIALAGYLFFAFLGSAVSEGSDGKLAVTLIAWAWIGSVALYVRFVVGARRAKPDGTWICANCHYTNGVHAVNCEACQQPWQPAPMTGPDAVRAYRGAGNPNSADALVLAQLREAGSDLSKPHSIEFFLYLPTEEAAQKGADQIRTRGFEVKVERVPEGGNWLCSVTKSIVPDLAILEGIRTEFEKTAKSLGGEYDGWGAPIVN